jgi:deazaflavin-dependent oxidoreductase (nitroreductase family)
MIGAQARAALESDLVIDITTTGRRSGQPRRLEIWFYNLDGRIYITGWPGRRDWYANLLACPDFTFHVKQSVRADIPACAHPVTATADREQILGRIIERIGRPDALQEWLGSAPLVEVEFPGA